MSRFYSKVKADQKKESAKAGHRNLVAEVSGWTSGAKIEAFINAEGKDAFRVFLTSGSNGLSKDKLIGTVIEGEFQRYIPGGDYAFP